MRLHPLVLFPLLAACGSSEHLPVRLDPFVEGATAVEAPVDGGRSIHPPAPQPRGEVPSWSEVHFPSVPGDNFSLSAVDTRGSQVLVAATTLRLGGTDDEQFGVHVFRWDGSALTELGAGWTLPLNVQAVTPSVGFDASGAPMVAWGELKRLRLFRWADGRWDELAAPPAIQRVWCSILVTDADRVVLAWRAGEGTGGELTLSELDAATGTFSRIAAPIAPQAGHGFWACPSVSLAGARTFVAWDENDEDGNSTTTTRSRIHVAEAHNGEFALSAPPLGVEGPTDNGDNCRLNWYPKLLASSGGGMTVTWKSCAGIHAVRIDSSKRPGPVTTIALNEDNPFPIRMLVDPRGMPMLISRTDDSPPTSFALRSDADNSWTRVAIGTTAGFYGGSGSVVEFDDSGALVIIAGRDLLRRMQLPE